MTSVCSMKCLSLKPVKKLTKVYIRFLKCLSEALAIYKKSPIENANLWNSGVYV